jgi:hypothetical protein
MQAALVAATAAPAAYGAYAQNRAASEQRKISNRNADLLDNQANDALERGAADVRRIHRSTRAMVGRQQAQAAAQGLDVSTGVPVDLTNDTLVMGAHDAAQAQQNAYDEAWGIRSQSSNMRQAGRYAYRAGRNQATGQLLGGLGDSARTYYQFDRPRIQGGDA